MTLHSKMAKEDTGNRAEKRRPQSDGAGPSNVKRHRCESVIVKLGEGSGSSGSQSSAGPSNVKRHRCDKVNVKLGEGSGSSGSQSSAGPSNVKRPRCDKVNVKLGEGSGSSGSQSSAGPSNVKRNRCDEENVKLGEGSGSSSSQSNAGCSNWRAEIARTEEECSAGSSIARAEAAHTKDNGDQSGAGSSGTRAEAAHTQDSDDENGAGSSLAHAKAAHAEDSGAESDTGSTYSKAETVCMDDLVEMRKAAASTPADVAVDTDSDVQEVVANSPEIVIIESDSEDADDVDAGRGGEVAAIIPADEAGESRCGDAVDAEPDIEPQNNRRNSQANSNASDASGEESDDSETDESSSDEEVSLIPIRKSHKCGSNCSANAANCGICRIKCVSSALRVERRSGLLSQDGSAVATLTCQRCGCKYYKHDDDEGGVNVTTRGLDGHAVMGIAKQLNCKIQMVVCPTYAVMRCVTHQKRVECVERQEPEYGGNDKIEPKTPAEERGLKRKWQEDVEKHRIPCECQKVQRYQVLAFEEEEKPSAAPSSCLEQPQPARHLKKGGHEIEAVGLSDSDVPLKKEDKKPTGQEADTQNWRQGLSNGFILP